MIAAVSPASPCVTALAEKFLLGKSNVNLNAFLAVIRVLRELAAALVALCSALGGWGHS